MKLYLSLLILFVGTFFTQQFVLSAIEMNIPKDASVFNLGKTYKSIFMGTIVTCIFVIMHDHQYNIFSYKYYLTLFIVAIVCVYLYRNQLEIKEEQYLREMNENSSNSILISESILKKTNNFDVARFAKNVIQKSTDEMNIIHDLLYRKKNKTLPN